MDTIISLLIASPVLALGTYRLARLLIEDVILDKPRNALFNRFDPRTNPVTYLFTCYWCLSMWISTALVISYIIIPVPVFIASTILALSALAGLVDDWKNR